MQEVTNKIWYIEEKQIKEYPGTYNEFSEWKSRQEIATEEAFIPAQVAEKEPDKNSELSYKELKRHKNLLRKLARDQEKLEADIEIP